MARQWMIEMRNRMHLTIEGMAHLCKCGPYLLREIEESDWITHPHIASRIADVYGMNLDRFNSLIPETRKMSYLPGPVDPPTCEDYSEALANNKIDYFMTTVEDLYE